MGISRGKDFELIVKSAFESVPNTSVYRLYDTMGGYSSVANIADFVIYHYPYQYFIECKTVLKGNTLSINSNDPKKKYGNISNTPTPIVFHNFHFQYRYFSNQKLDLFLLKPENIHRQLVPSSYYQYHN